MITSIAIDDEPKALEVIERYCRKTSLVTLRATFREPVKAIEFLNREKVDVIFLDINMPDISGIQLVQTLSSRPMIIFTTAYSHYAVESYDLNAVDYLLKPITFERFLAAVNKAETFLAMKNKASFKSEVPETIFIKSGSQTHHLKISEILYLQKDGNYITIVLKDKKILIRENMTDIFDIVPQDEFVRVHKSFVVAIRHIAMIEVHQLMINNEKIPIGSTYREPLRMRLGLE
ncbi:LytR/AlgR family response regulator transcription factor [Mucilaginibacter gotjawali]|uniref:Transcriptional regulatory protein YpdB n=2 Tax=Mucilaginibacter gotjawali TaxID=1550579 RepID=A0A110B0H2_9SPHI|nr:LytTR family DNA-binding domain-containing protein [Mucilaginibacter gotjawali]MBB3057893.1 DNA-binding LytR/AlgR family response regulator [Mucilaginibacter gotjawali]BAU52335.1 Transcriptional regulatory protein YpdB [Mucilaginibacter gotjawali]